MKNGPVGRQYKTCKRGLKIEIKFSAEKLIMAEKQWNREMEKVLKNKMATKYLSIQRFDHGFSNNF